MSIRTSDYRHRGRGRSGTPINVNDPEADALTRRFPTMAGVGITEAIALRHRSETPQATAARLRAKHGITLGEAA